MANIIVSLRIAAKYFRDERWDIIGRGIEVLKAKYLDRQGQELSDEAIVKALNEAGGKLMSTQLMAGKPRYQLRGITKIGYLQVRFTAFDDGSLKIEPAQE